VIGLWRAICAIHPGRSIAKRAFDGGPVLVGPGLIDAAWGPCELGNTARRRDCNARCVTASLRQCRERAADELAAAERSIGRIKKTLEDDAAAWAVACEQA
jgi:hypothetical protein